MTGEIGDKRFTSPADSRWDREVHAAKGLVVERQWQDGFMVSELGKFVNFVRSMQ